METDLTLPNYGKFSSFCGPRIREIQALENDLNNCEHGLRAFQKLPRNLQRRNVSYNPQRLPRYLREKHKREIGNKIKIAKRPCRKYRRRPANLLMEYNRRQRSQVWLETHIWHAKRFHLTRKWGYVLPKTPTAKGFRATLRAASESCMIQDVSYECCLELEGPSSEIHERLSSVMPPNETTKLFDSEAVGGRKWIETTFYKQQKFPFGVIGNVQIICASQTWTESSYKLWLWVHPSIYEEVLSILIEIFNYKLVTSEDDKATEDLKPADHVTSVKLSTKNIPVQKAPKYYSSEGTKLTVLKDTLVKFRVIGPRSYSMLRKVLIPSQVLTNNNNNNNNDEDDNDKKCEDNQDSVKEQTDIDKTPWWISFFSIPDHVEKYDEQLSLWNSLKENYSTSRKVLSLVVRDVRSILPYKKQCMEYEEVGEGSPEEIYASSALHPIFDCDIRESVTRSMKSNHDINIEREKIMVPGTLLPVTDDESRVPVMLLQRPGSLVSGFGSGWDMILPSGWATQTLIACVLNGAVVGGQAEADSLMKEFLTQPRPYDLPDSNAGLLNAEQEKQERADEHFRKPPNCRQNYLTLGVKFPFGIDWIELMKDWDSSCEKFYVLRDKMYLKFLSIKSCKKIEKLSCKRLGIARKRKASGIGDDVPEKYQKVEEKAVPVKASSQDQNIQDLVPVKAPGQDQNIQCLIRDLKNSLLYVRLILIGKGSMESFATICLPSEDDLSLISEHGGAEIVEPRHEDKNSKKRKDLKTEHTKNLKHLRRKRKKARNDVLCGKENPLEKHSTMQEALDAAVDVVKKENTDMVKNIESYNSNISCLWFQSPEETFQSNSRKIIGYSTQGGYCMRLGRSGGLGYVVTEALLGYMVKRKMFEDEDQEQATTTSTNQNFQKQIMVLTRNPSSFQYKWARLVILDI